MKRNPYKHGDTVIGLDSHTVENRKVVLENDMIEQWSSVYKESDSLSSALTKVLSNHQMDMQGFMGSGKVQEEYLETVFYDMVEVLQYNSTSGIFLVLGNDGDTDSEGGIQRLLGERLRSPDQNGFPHGPADGAWK